MEVEAIAGTAKRKTRVNYIGLRAGKLVAIEVAGKSRDGHQLLRCRCECGNLVLRSSVEQQFAQEQHRLDEFSLRLHADEAQPNPRAAEHA